MKGYSSTDVFTDGEQEALVKAVRLVDSLPDSREVRCHELVRAVALCLSSMYYVVDGHYGSFIEHSWLHLAPSVILDVYCIGRMPMVQLIDLSHYTHRHATLYIPGRARDDIQGDVINNLLSQMQKVL